MQKELRSAYMSELLTPYARLRYLRSPVVVSQSSIVHRFTRFLGRLPLLFSPLILPRRRSKTSPNSHLLCKYEAGFDLFHCQTQKRTPFGVPLRLAAELGFEPRHTESESAVLPLHNSAKCVAIISQDILLVNCFFKISNQIIVCLIIL